MPKVAKEFPALLLNSELVQHGYGPCETYAEPTMIELRLENGILTLWPDGTWDWHSTSHKKGDE